MSHEGERLNELVPNNKIIQLIVDLYRSAHLENCGDRTKIHQQ